MIYYHSYSGCYQYQYDYYCILNKLFILPLKVIFSLMISYSQFLGRLFSEPFPLPCWWKCLYQLFFYCFTHTPMACSCWSVVFMLCPQCCQNLKWQPVCHRGSLSLMKKSGWMFVLRKYLSWEWHIHAQETAERGCCAMLESWDPAADSELEEFF